MRNFVRIAFTYSFCLGISGVILFRARFFQPVTVDFVWFILALIPTVALCLFVGYRWGQEGY